MSRLRTDPVGSVLFWAWIIVFCTMPMWASAQEDQTMPQAQAPLAPGPYDPPPGFPYNTGASTGVSGGVISAQAQVPLRDFLSSRQDHQRAEIIDRIKELEKQLRQIIDERDKQYAQRFAAQEASTDRALSAARELSSQAMASAKEAVTKAENSNDKRFEAGNEIKAAMAEQSTTFMRISTADARFTALEEKVNSVYDRLNAMQAQGRGSAETWGWLVVVAGVLIAFAVLLFNINKSRQREHGDRPS